MPASINSTSSSPGGLVTTGDVDNELVIQTGDVTAISIDASQNVTFAGAVSTSGAVSATTLTVNSNNISADNSLGFRNRIINGDMRIDQRNAGAAVTIDSAALTYSVDRWGGYGQGSAGVFTLQQSTTVPTGFINSLKVTVTTADASIAASDFYTLQQRIEGFNVADLGWGTANAKTVTLSFWVRSSLTGTFSGALVGAAFARSYPFTYSISAANTWEQKTVTVAGDTSGSWVTNNGTGLVVYFDLGSGSDYEGTVNSWNGALDVRVASSVRVISTLSADWYITGVQLEVGSVATPFERRPYGTELALCQRYFEKSYDQGTAPTTNTTTGTFNFSGASEGNGNVIVPIQYSVKRTAPTLTGYLSSGSSGSWNYERSGTSSTGSITFDRTSDRESRAYVAVGANFVAAYVYGHWIASAEL